tara:strand:+ start:293 stop:658 length:366 start_codon:yes stop_codon:yes gene_type:complete
MAIKYKIRSAGDVEDILHVESKISIPKDPDNRHYQEFLQDVKEQGIGIVEGPEVDIRIDYKIKRVEAYPPIGDQLDKIYHHGIDAWKADIKMIKDQFPDSQVGLSTTANVPDWVQTEVDKL